MKYKIKFGIVLIAILLISSIVIAEDWTTNKSYNVGDIVTYNDVNYKCMQSHTSQAGWTPLIVPALWQKIEIVVNNNDWTTNKAYNIGDSVIYNDINYVVRQSHTSQAGWTPDIVPALFLRDIDNTEKDSLKDKLADKYNDKFENQILEDIKISTKYTIYDVIVTNEITGITSSKTWIVKNGN